MKKKNIILSSIIGIICLIAGFIIGISVDFPKVKKSELAGTIGKLDKYRNVKLSEQDLKLRNELFTDSVLRNNYIRFFSMNYSFYSQISVDIDFSLEAIKNSTDFTNNYETEVKGIETFAGLLESKRPEILLAIGALIDPSEEDSKIILQTVENAKSSIARLLQMESSLVDIIDAMEVYIENSPTDFNDELKKAHDLLIKIKMFSAKVYKDRIMLKYLDTKKPFITDPEIIKQIREKNNIEVGKIMKIELAALYTSEEYSDIIEDICCGSNTEILQVVNMPCDKFDMNETQLLESYDIVSFGCSPV